MIKPYEEMSVPEKGKLQKQIKEQITDNFCQDFKILKNIQTTDPDIDLDNVCDCIDEMVASNIVIEKENNGRNYYFLRGYVPAQFDLGGEDGRILVVQAGPNGLPEGAPKINEQRVQVGQVQTAAVDIAAPAEIELPVSSASAEQEEDPAEEGIEDTIDPDEEPATIPAQPAAAAIQQTPGTPAKSEGYTNAPLGGAVDLKNPSVQEIERIVGVVARNHSDVQIAKQLGVTANKLTYYKTKPESAFFKAYQRGVLLRAPDVAAKVKPAIAGSGRKNKASKAAPGKRANPATANNTGTDKPAEEPAAIEKEQQGQLEGSIEVPERAAINPGAPFDAMTSTGLLRATKLLEISLGLILRSEDDNIKIEFARQIGQEIMSSITGVVPAGDRA